LPYLDQAPLYNQLNFSEEVNDVVNNGDGTEWLVSNVLTAYRCPSDDALPQVNDSGITDAAISNYAAVCDDSSISGKDGIMFLNGDTAIENIADGTSNTLLVGERGSLTGKHFGVGPTRRSVSTIQTLSVLLVSGSPLMSRALKGSAACTKAEPTCYWVTDRCGFSVLASIQHYLAIWYTDAITKPSVSSGAA